MTQALHQLCRESRGATAIEYALIASLVVIVMLVGFDNFADSATTMFNNVAEAVSNST